MSDGAEQARQAGPTRPEEEKPVGGPAAHCPFCPLLPWAYLLCLPLCPRARMKRQKRGDLWSPINGLRLARLFMSLRQKEPGNHAKKVSTKQALLLCP